MTRLIFTAALKTLGESSRCACENYRHHARYVCLQAIKRYKSLDVYTLYLVPISIVRGRRGEGEGEQCAHCTRRVDQWKLTLRFFPSLIYCRTQSLTHPTRIEFKSIFVLYVPQLLEKMMSFVSTLSDGLYDGIFLNLCTSFHASSNERVIGTENNMKPAVKAHYKVKITKLSMNKA